MRGFLTPRCYRCGFAHALPQQCSNCGTADPMARHRRLIKSLVLVTLVIVVTVFYAAWQKSRALDTAGQSEEQPAHSGR